MKIGTRSLIYGAHAFYIHPWFVALGWYKIYGVKDLIDPRLWLCFLVHDWGYWGKPNMDGPEGETHPELGAKIVEFFCGKTWGEFCLLHSRFYAKKLDKRYSKLCVADKMALVLTPSWIYIPCVWLSGELKEYQDLDRETKYLEANFDHSNVWSWHKSIRAYIKKWVEIHKNVDKDDTWASR